MKMKAEQKISEAYNISTHDAIQRTFRETSKHFNQFANNRFRLIRVLYYGYNEAIETI